MLPAEPFTQLLADKPIYGEKTILSDNGQVQVIR